MKIGKEKTFFKNEIKSDSAEDQVVSKKKVKI
jgi:hypothetical protein